eukprot:3024716-Alexandrium_andersonii.AAC.1
MDVDTDAPDSPPANYRLVDLTEPPVPYAGDLMAPVGEYSLSLSSDPMRCGCRCGGTITLEGTGEA